MKAYDQLGFLTYASSKTEKPLMLISVDSDLVDENGRDFEKRFCMLDSDLLDELRISGVAFAEFPNLDEAKRIFGMTDFASRQIDNIGLYAVLFHNGQTLGGISQEKSLVDIAPRANCAL